MTGISASSTLARILGPERVTWDASAALLYAVGVGETGLAYATENSHDRPQQVLPTFGVIVCDAFPAIELLGAIDHGAVVHGREALRVHGPLPPAGSLDVRCGVTHVVDKGPGGHVFVDLTSNGFDLAGRLVVERTITVVLRGAGGSFGSETWTPPRAEGGTASLRVPSIEAVLRPAREPDLARTFAVDEDLPLVYRLSGDRNPLHSDPWFATVRAGFPRTILHGLCTLGIAGRTLLHDLCEGDPAQFVAVSARFAAPVFPGETLTTKVWEAGDAGSAFEVWASGNEHAPERPVLDSGVCMRRASTREDES